MCRGLALSALAILIGLTACPSAVAQESARAALLGTWEGKIVFGESARAVLAFSESAGVLKWTYSYKYDAGLWGDAEGTVTSFAPPALTLAGTWTKHAVSGAVGTGVTFILTVAGDLMKGTVTAEINKTPIEISLARKR